MAAQDAPITEIGSLYFAIGTLLNDVSYTGRDVKG